MILMPKKAPIHRETSFKHSNTDKIITKGYKLIRLKSYFFIQIAWCHWKNGPKVFQLNPWSQGSRNLISVYRSHSLKMVTSSTLFVTLTKKIIEEKAKDMPPPFPFLTCAAHSATNEFKITLKKTQECFKMEEDLKTPENASSDLAKVLIAIRTNKNEFGAHTQDDLMKLGSKFNYIIYSNSFYDQVE